jgi:hypothetical protein
MAKLGIEEAERWYGRRRGLREWTTIKKNI